MNIQKFLVSFFLCILLKRVKTEIWPHHEILDEKGRYHLYWKSPEDTSIGSEIIFKVEVAAKGCVELGLSLDGNIPGSDIVTGWVKQGQAYIQDRHGTGNRQTTLDEKQDWILMHGRENVTHTILVFRRKLDTCDENDMVIDGSTIRVIYGFSDVDPIEKDHCYHYKHRGMKSIIFLNHQFPVPEDPFMKYWVVTANNFDISAYESIYWCKIFKSPFLHEKHQIVKVEPIIQEGHEQFTHHFVLYECVDGTPEEFEGLLDDDGYDCTFPTGNSPPQVEKCEGAFIGWADGGKSITYSDVAAIPLEAGPGKYYKLETHYDNSQRMQGIFDNSGLRISYTNQLRKYDSSAFFVGGMIRPRVFIPPSQESFIVAGHSNPQCFDHVMPPDGINIFGALLHTHITGSKLVLRHFRGKKELPPIAMDNNFDFHHQEIRYLKHGVKFLPGDQMTLECTYNTSTRYTTTFSGLSTREEMCLVHVLYYPVIERRYYLLSGPTLKTINKVLGTNLKVENDVYDLFNYNWTNVDVSKVEYYLRNSKHHSECRIGNGEVIVKNLISYPSGLEPYVPPERMCGVRRHILKHRNYEDGYFQTPLRRKEMTRRHPE